MNLQVAETKRGGKLDLKRDEEGRRKGNGKHEPNKDVEFKPRS